MSGSGEPYYADYSNKDPIIETCNELTGSPYEALVFQRDTWY